jgi:hypothetical protein
MKPDEKKSYAGGGVVWALMGAFAFGCLIGIAVFAPVIARAFVR